jgi:hypothetical protein
MRKEQIKQMGVSYDQLSPKLKEAVDQYESSLEQIEEIESELQDLEDEERGEAIEELKNLKMFATKLHNTLKLHISKIKNKEPEGKPTYINNRTPEGNPNPEGNPDPEEKKGGGLLWVLGAIGLGLLGMRALKK